MIVDSNQAKHGMTFDFIDLEVCPVDQLRQKNYDYVLLASQYWREILETYKKDFGLSIPAVTIDPELRIHRT